jgi:GGDEF domain-containing protein
MPGIMAVVGPGWYPTVMPEAPFGARRPRPVADVPPAALADGQLAAKGWLLALMAARPLHEASALPVASLTREAPALCAAALRAVGSDAEAGLAPLAAGAGALAGAADAAAVAAAIGHLRSALWEALLATMGPLDAATTAALAERLGWVCDAILADALAAPARAPLDWRQALERHAGDRRPVALLALELPDAERLVAAGADAALASADRAVRGELRPGDALGGQDAGRWWVVAPEPGAHALAARLADAVAAVTVHGAPLALVIGIATWPEDGTDAEALAALADERLFAARATGVPIA